MPIRPPSGPTPRLLRLLWSYDGEAWVALTVGESYGDGGQREVSAMVRKTVSWSESWLVPI